MEILGLCRFSYVSKGRGAWQSVPSELEERKRAVLCPERLKMRFIFLERYLAPSLKMQTDPNFKFAFLTSTEMPTEFKEKLLDLFADSPHITVRFRPVDYMQAAIDEISEEIGARREIDYLTFRIDDDDALSVHFIHRLRQNASHLKAPCFITFPKGYTLAHKSDLTPDWVVETMAPYTSQGLSRFSPTGDFGNIYEFGHHKIRLQFDSITLPRSVSYLCGRHHDHDSEAEIPKRKETVEFAAALPHLEYEFPFLTRLK